MAKKHFTVTEVGEYSRITPDKNYVIKNKKSQRIYEEVVTKDVNNYEAVHI